MIKRFTFFKSVLLLIAVLMASFTLVACGESDQTVVDNALATVDLVFASGDSATSVTQNLTLPTTVGDVEIAWVSGNPSVISNTGVVTRQEADTNVTLTATLTLNEATATKSFTLKVLAAPVVIDPMDALDAIVLSGDGIGYNYPTGLYAATGDFTLPTTSMGLAVSWSSSNAAVISTAGVVVRPAYGQSNSTVILTATIGDQTKDFIVTVLAITTKPVDLILSDAKDSLLLAGIGDGVAADLDLPATAGTEGVTVTWTSSNTDVITDDGVVTRPSEGNVTVTLTATLHYADQTTTKTFDVVVLTFEPYTTLTTIAEAITLQATNGDSYVEIPDLTVVGVFSTGYMVYDGTTIMQVYGAPGTDVVDGAVFTIRGMMTNYYGSLELTGTTNAPLVLTASTATAAVLTPTEVTTTVTDYISSLPPHPLTAPLDYQYIQINARVRVQNPTDNYQTFLVDPGYTGADIDSSSASPFTTNALMIYYPSNIAAVRQFDGLNVTINVFLFSLRTDRNIFTVIFTGVADDIALMPLTDPEAVQAAQDNLATLFANEYVLDKTVTLPTDIGGVAISWASDNVLFDVTTGAITMPATGREMVTATATLTKGDATGEFTKTFYVGEKPVQTAAEAIATDLGELVRVQGVVTAGQYYRTFFIQDATGGIAVYTSNADMIAFLIANYGKEVDIIGTRAAYNGLNQISNTLIYTLVGDATMPTAMNIDAMGLDATALADYQGQLVELTGLAVTAINTDTYGNVTVTLYDATANKSVMMKWDSRVTLGTTAADLLASLAVDDVVNVVNPLAWANGPYLYFTDSTQITKQTLTDAERVALAKAAVVGSFAAEYNEATTLDLQTSLFGVTVAYDTASEYFTVATGAITMPTMEVGRATVSVTINFTLGTETDSATVEFAVGVPLISSLYTTADATIVTVQGIVIADEYYNTFSIQDSSGAVSIYTSDAAMTANLVVGNLVQVTGELDFYSGLVEVKPSEVIVVSTGNTLPAVLDIESYNLDSVTLLDMQSQQVSLSELVVNTVYVDNYGNITITFLDVSSDKTVQMKWDSRQTLTTEAQAQIDAVAVGDIVDLQTVLGWKNGPYLFYSNTSVITDVATPSAAALAAADVAMVNADAAALVVPATVEANTTLTLPATGANGSAIVWASTDDLVIDHATGAVVIPVSGQVTVTLTASLTLNAAVKEVTFDVLVGVPAAPVIYSTGFEAPDFATSTTYNNTTEALFGPSGSQWGFLNGTVSTTGPLAGTQSAQMRWYTTAPTVLGSMVSKFTFTDVSKVDFVASAYAGINVTVSYSLNGTDWLGAQVFTLTTTAASYSYDVNVTGNVYLQFALTLNGTPTVTSRLLIDTIEVYGTAA